VAGKAIIRVARTVSPPRETEGGIFMSKRNTNEDDLFTADEHAILARWFGVEPRGEANSITAENAINRLGFAEKPAYRTLLDVAVAFIVLRKTEPRLPQWNASRGDEVVFAHEYRDRITRPDRRILMQPRPLFEINWAGNAPGSGWAVTYYLTSVPIFRRYVVTASGNNPDALGYCNFALGAFRGDEPIKNAIRDIICADWKLQYDERNQQRWTHPFRAGFVTEVEANEWADDVWEDKIDALLEAS
jgi:hypothetical protein